MDLDEGANVSVLELTGGQDVAQRGVTRVLGTARYGSTPARDQKTC